MCSLKISQASSVSEMSEVHQHELATAVDLDGVPVTYEAADILLEFVFVEEKHNLSEECFPLGYGLQMAFDGYGKITEVLIEKDDACKLLLINR